MKLFLLFVCIVASGSIFAGSFEDGNYSSGTQIEEAGSDDAITINVLNTWPIPEGTRAGGIDYIPNFYSAHIVSYIDHGDDVLYFLDIDDGSSAFAGGWPLDASNTSGWGTCYVPHASDQRHHVNDFNYDGVFSKYWSTAWVEYDALTDKMGRGMDYHSGMDKIFEFYTSGTSGNYKWYVAIFTPGQSTGSSYQLDCVNPSATRYGSGCCLYPMWNGNTGIAVTMYNSQWIRFFEYPGHAGEQFYSHGIIPYSIDSGFSEGLTYSEERDTFFHSYRSGSIYYISELEISEAVLEADTWAGIKSSF